MRVGFAILCLVCVTACAPNAAPVASPSPAPAGPLSEAESAAQSPLGPGETTSIPSTNLDPPAVTPPAAMASVRFAIIGDTGTGTESQYEIGTQLARARARFPFDFVIMVGDNMYGSERPQDFARKFEQPYRALLAAKVPFYAALGNHDDPTQRYYTPFNMNGERYYTYRKGDARFFVLDSNYMDGKQLTWLESQLAASSEPWKVAYFHHPPYSTGGRHGSEVDLRTQVEPLFVKYGVDVVFSGHEHFYERITPQRGIYYFIEGGSAKLARGDIHNTPLKAAGFDTDYSFMLAELDEDAMRFQVIARTGMPVDSGALRMVVHPKPPPNYANRPQ